MLTIFRFRPQRSYLPAHAHSKRQDNIHGRNTITSNARARTTARNTHLSSLSKSLKYPTTPPPPPLSLASNSPSSAPPSLCALAMAVCVSTSTLSPAPSPKRISAPTTALSRPISRRSPCGVMSFSSSATPLSHAMFTPGRARGWFASSSARSKGSTGTRRASAPAYRGKSCARRLSVASLEGASYMSCAAWKSSSVLPRARA